MICLKCGINQISIVHLFYGFLSPKVSVGFLLSVSIELNSCKLKHKLHLISSSFLLISSFHWKNVYIKIELNSCKLKQKLHLVVVFF